jgi:hypothetical protein
MIFLAAYSGLKIKGNQWVDVDTYIPSTPTIVRYINSDA